MLDGRGKLVLSATVEKLGKYEVLKKLADGGMGEVFLARSGGRMGFDSVIVIKTISRHLSRAPAFAEQFRAEAELATQLDHPNLTRAYDFGEHKGRCFLAMEHVDGESLRVVCERRREKRVLLPATFCAHVVAQAAAGVAHAHALRDRATGEPLGLLHRSLTPANVLVSRAGQVKVTDFGMAEAAALNVMPADTLASRLKYMAPEHLQRLEALDPRVDVYSLGIILYELLTGATPFDATPEADITRTILSGKRIPATALRRDLPRELALVIDRAIGPRDARQASCDELQAELERFIQGTGEPMGPTQVFQVLAAVGALPAGGAPDPASELDPTRIGSAREIHQLARRTVSGETSVDIVITAANQALPPAFQLPPAPTEGIIHLTQSALNLASMSMGKASLTQEVVDLRPAFPEEAYTQVQIHNPSLELTELEKELPDAPEQPPDPRANAPASVRSRSRRGPAGTVPETVVMRAPAGLADEAEPARGWIGAVVGICAVALVLAGVGIVVLGSQVPVSVRAPPPAPATRDPAPVHSHGTGPASVRIATSVPASVRVDGNLVGEAPVELKELKPGELRVELSNPTLGFRTPVLLELAPGDNGTKQIEIKRLAVELRVQPRAHVSVDGLDLGELESTKVELFEGWHTLRAVDRKGRHRTENFIVVPELPNRFSYDLGR